MLDGIFTVLTDIGDFFASVIDFVVSMVDDLVQFVTNLVTAADQIASILSGFPLFFITGIVSLIATMVVLRVVGRD